MDLSVEFNISLTAADSSTLIEALHKQRIALSDAADDQFPVEQMDLLRRLGVLLAPLPRCEGGLGWGTEETGLAPLCSALQILGRGSLVIGRVYEAHVNAIALVMRYGDARARATAATAVRDGHLFALWVAPAREPVRAIRSGSLLHVTGRKPFCTAAGFATRAVITALDENGFERMILIDAARGEIEQSAGLVLHGMRGTSTKPVEFDREVRMEQCFGSAGDYTREPDFSAGAWRTSAVTVGGLQALVDETISQLRARGRHSDPHQAARIGQMLIKFHSAAMWASSAAERVKCGSEPQYITGYVNLARLAIEQVCLEVIQLAQRSLGLSGLTTSNPVEGMMRDMVTYLRQPAGDEALTEAAITFAETVTPSSLGFCP